MRSADRLAAPDKMRGDCIMEICDFFKTQRHIWRWFLIGVKLNLLWHDKLLERSQIYTSCTHPVHIMYTNTHTWVFCWYARHTCFENFVIPDNPNLDCLESQVVHIMYTKRNHNSLPELRPHLFRISKGGHQITTSRISALLRSHTCLKSTEG